jgi:hypothetical protein
MARPAPERTDVPRMGVQALGEGWQQRIGSSTRDLSSVSEHWTGKDGCSEHG